MKNAVSKLMNRRVKAISPLIPPQILIEDYPLTLRAADTVLEGRNQVEAILRGDDDRLLVIVGLVTEPAQTYSIRWIFA